MTGWGRLGCCLKLPTKLDCDSRLLTLLVEDPLDERNMNYYISRVFFFFPCGDYFLWLLFFSAAYNFDNHLIKVKNYNYSLHPPSPPPCGCRLASRS